jgi:hypothetical protein
MLTVYLDMSETQRLGLRVVQRFLGLLGQAVDVHGETISSESARRTQCGFELFDAGQKVKHHSDGGVIEPQPDAQPLHPGEDGQLAGREFQPLTTGGQRVQQAQRNQPLHLLGVQPGGGGKLIQ